jgi:ABC-type sugar transport system ATPase subunit
MALLGSNGSGKSTMIKVLAGLVNPNAGEIFIDDLPVSIQSGRDSHVLGIATAYQDLSLVPTMSVLDNIMLGNEIMGRFGTVSRKQALDTVHKLLERFHIDCDPDDYVQTLMPSTQSMLEVARAVSLKPRLLLLDEVTASLHHDEVEILFDIMRQLKEEGVAIVYVTHRMKEIVEICDKATIMRSGETVAVGEVKDFTLDDIVFHMTAKRPEAQSAQAFDYDSGENSELVLQVDNLLIAPKVRDISFRAYKGQITGIAGLEGQGQPECMRAVLGEVKPEDGEIHYLGKPSSFSSPAEAVKQGVGFISGERNREAIFSIRSVAENICAGDVAKGQMFKYYAGKYVREFAQRAMDTYEVVAGSLRAPASSLSGGNQQKLVVARWLAVNPILLLLDDPTKGVDTYSRHEIHKMLKKCAADGMTILISSSDNEELLDLADCIYVFYEGKVSGRLAGEGKTHERLVAAMMGLSEDKKEGGRAV